MTATPMLPPAAFRPSAAALLRRRVEEVDVRHRATRSCRRRSRRSPRSGRRPRTACPGRCTTIANSSVGISSSSALMTVQLRPPNLGTANVYGSRSSDADQVGQRDQQEQLLRGEREARPCSRNAALDAPEQPDREAEVLGEDRADQVAAGDLPAAALPERRVLRVPVVDPAVARGTRRSGAVSRPVSWSGVTVSVADIGAPRRSPDPRVGS